MTTQKASDTVLGMGNQQRQQPKPTREHELLLAAFDDADAFVVDFDRANAGLPAVKAPRINSYPGKQGYSPRERKALVRAAMLAKVAARDGGDAEAAKAATAAATEHCTGAVGVATAAAVADSHTLTGFELAAAQSRRAALDGHPHRLPHIALLAARVATAQAAVAHIPATA